jgi:N4-gp56 family major capsid protein
MANTTTLNSELFQNLLVQSEFALYENSIARQVAQVYDYPVGAGKVVQIPFWDSITSSKPGEGTAPSAINTDTNSKTITLEEHVAFASVTDFLRDSAQDDVIANLSTQMGLALGEGLDKELITKFEDSTALTASGVTQSVGSAGNDNTVDQLMAAAATIRANKYAGPLFALLHPAQAYGIKKALTATTSFQNATDVGSAVLGQYFVGNIAGITILEHPLVNVDGDDDGFGAVFAPSAFGVAQRGGVAIETERNAAARSTDVVLTVTAGVGVLRPELIVSMVGDALAD